MLLPPHLDDRTARAALTRLFEPGDTVGLALVAEYGAPTALRIAIGAKPARPFGDITEHELAHGLSRWNRNIPDLKPVEDLAKIALLGGGFLIPSDDLWPAALNDLADPPLGLWYRGDITAGIPALDKCVALIGSRDCTDYGASVTQTLSSELAQRGICVVSGLGYGIDTGAHQAALAGALGTSPATIAVVAHGVDRVYPSGSADLAATIYPRGLMLSELAPGVAANRHRFTTRNRVIAALSGVTCVVESGSRDAVMNTARVASSLGRTVTAVPGSIHSMKSAGCHTLIREGVATLVTDVENVVELLEHTTAGASA